MKVKGFMKLAYEIMDLELNPNEFTVLVKLLRVEKYREYKGEIKDGWFIKSKSELAKECGIKSINTLNSTLKSLSNFNTLEYRITQNKLTEFKLTVSNFAIPEEEDMSNFDSMSKIDGDDKDMSKIDSDSMSKIDSDSMSKIDTLHYIIEESNKQQNDNTSLMTVDTGNSTNNNTTHSEEKEKEEYDIACMTSYQKEGKVEEQTTLYPNAVPIVEKYDDTPIPVYPVGYHSSKMEKLLSEFKPREEKLKEGEDNFPTIEELRCIAYLENLSFSRKDFKSVYDGSNKNGYWYPNSLLELMLSVVNKMKVFVEKYNFTYKCSHKPYQDMIRSFLETNYKHFNIKVPSNY